MKIEFETLEEKIKQQEEEAYLSQVLSKINNNKELDDFVLRDLIANYRVVEDKKGRVFSEQRTSYIKLRDKYYEIKWIWHDDGWYRCEYSKPKEVFIKREPKNE